VAVEPGFGDEDSDFGLGHWGVVYVKDRGSARDSASVSASPSDGVSASVTAGASASSVVGPDLGSPVSVSVLGPGG
jgi:hypothetical protein